MVRNAIRTTMLAVALIGAPAAVADYAAGQQAWDAGRLAEAVSEWRAAADAGDRRAMLALGRRYAQGLGVVQDYVEAHKWLNLAASLGEAAAVEERDALAARMTSQQVATAQERAAAWRPGADRVAGLAESSETGRTAGAAEAAGTPGAAGAQAAAPAASASASDVGPPPPRAIREAQALLAALGYAPGPANGTWGRRTGQAYQAFLRDAGRPVAERLTPEALRAMRTIAKRQSSAAPRPAPLRPDALHRAAQAGDIVSLEAVLATVADIDARDSRGWTALMHAVNKGYTLLTAPLLAADADPDVRAPDGATALFMAVVHGHTEIIALLMEAAANISLKGPKGKTVVDVARARYGDADTARENGEPPAVLALLEGRTLAEEDDRRFAQAQEAGTIAAYGEYLSSWPQGRHVEVAQRSRAKLVDALRKVEEYERLVKEHRRLAEEGGEEVARRWQAGMRFRDCDECPELVVVPAGSFDMGSPESEAGRNDDEGPVHRVRIERPFAVGVYEVTRGEYSRFVSATGYSSGDSCWTYEGGEWEERRGRDWRSPGYEQTDAHPVVCVNWDDAKAYVRWLSERTEKAYRLLSESEWEYMARGGTKRARYWGWGASKQCRYANGAGREVEKRYSDWSGSVRDCNDGHVHTSPVGSYKKNKYGLHDVLGNVWEWVEDCWNDSYRGVPADGSAWESGDCSLRVLRGGSWLSRPRGLRSANRLRFVTGDRGNYYGFRVARTLIP